jgi:hypothetical protein
VCIAACFFLATNFSKALDIENSNVKGCGKENEGEALVWESREETIIMLSTVMTWCDGWEEGFPEKR